MKWLKRIGGIFVGLLVIGGILLLVLTMAFNRLLVAGVPVVVPPMTGTDASLEASSLSILRGGGTLEGFVLGPPEGFTQEAFRLDTVGARIRICSLFRDVLVVEEVLVDGARITVEWNTDGKANLSTLYRHLAARSGDPEEGPAPELGLEEVLGQVREILEEIARRRQPPEPERPETEPRRPEETDDPAKRVVIRRFVFRNSQVRATGPVLGGQEVTFVLPMFHLEDIGGVVAADGSFDERTMGVTAEEAARQVLAQLIPLLAKNLVENQAWMPMIRDRAAGMLREYGGDLLGEQGRELIERHGGALLETEAGRALEERLPPAARDVFRMAVPGRGGTERGE